MFNRGAVTGCNHLPRPNLRSQWADLIRIVQQSHAIRLYQIHSASPATDS